MLQSIQALRGIAVLAVVIFHLKLFKLGLFGVDLFFVISGFIMGVTSRNRTASEFILARLIRIVPLYWLLTSLTCVLRMCGAPPYSPFGFTELAKSLLFLPFYEPTGHIWPLLIPGWTLNYEMFFYMVFGICMLTRQAALSVIALLLILVLAGLLMAPEDPMLRIWTGPLLLEFGLGVLISTLMIPNSTGVAISSLLMSLALAVLFIVCRKVFELDLEHPLPRVTLIGGASGALVVAGLTLEKLKELPDLNILRWLGDRSYSLYLVHLPIIDTARHLFGTGIFALTGMFLISIVLAHWVYVCGEQVATNWLKQRLGLSRVPKPAVARA